VCTSASMLLNMTPATIPNDGDALERLHWEAIRPSFPHYEEFWRTHLVPLRSEGTIFPREGIDEDFEFLAMSHYSVFVYLSRSLEKIKEAGQNFRFPGEVYVDLYAATDTAKKAVIRWSNIYRACIGKEPRVDTQKIEKLQERFRKYRNLVHEQLPAIRLDDDRGVLMFRPDQVGAYPKWTHVIYRARPEDFVEVTKQLTDDYQSLSSALENAWKKMCTLSEQLVENAEYFRRRGQGRHDVRIVLRSSATSSAVYSPTAVNCIMSSGGGPTFKP
jgi:hypothetical protein